MSSQYIVTRVCNSETQLQLFNQSAALVREKFPNLVTNTVNNIQDLFPKLSNSKFHTDLIQIPIDELYHNDNACVFDLINTLSTIIKCTVFRIRPGKPQKRTTEIMCMIGENTDPKLIRETMRIPDVTIGYLEGEKFTPNVVCEHALKWIHGDRNIPKQILALLKSKKKIVKVKSVSDGINLTVRQNQILQLVKERGASNKIIARMLNISESTVKLHMSAIFKKYGVKNRTQLVLFSGRDEKLIC